MTRDVSAENVKYAFKCAAKRLEANLSFVKTLDTTDSATNTNTYRMDLK